ncbi:hypothetical protein HDU91_007333, partial [Kappamyces sp. JEL0680]
MRVLNAFVTPSGLILGLSLQPLFSSFLILLNKAAVARTTLWRLSLVAFLCVLSFVFWQVIVLDLQASPYPQSTHWLGVVLFGNYLTNQLATISIASLLVSRVRIFYGSSSRFAMFMTLFACLVVLAKACGNGIGLKVSVDSYFSRPYDYRDNALYTYIPLVESSAMALEGMFQVSGTVSFIHYLLGGSAFARAKSEQEVNLIKAESLRLFLVASCSIVDIVFALWVVLGSDDYINHNAYYLPSLIYSLMLYSFLDLSYNKAKNILMSRTTSSPGGMSTMARARAYSSEKSFQFKGESIGYPEPVTSNTGFPASGSYHLGRSYDYSAAEYDAVPNVSRTPSTRSSNYDYN